MFVLALDCMDGRTKQALMKWVESAFSSEFRGMRISVDLVTEPGVDGILSQGPKGIIAELQRKAFISRDKHGSRIALITGHEDCAGHPVGKDEHVRDVKKGAERVLSWGFGRVIGLYFSGVNGSCGVEKIIELSTH